MEILKFKTNINCGGCVNAVTAHFSQVKGIGSWKVDTLDPNKILTIESALHAQEIIEILTQAGFRAEKTGA